MDFSSDLNLLSANIVVWCAVIWVLAAPLRLFLKHAERFDKEYAALHSDQIRWIIWPAIALNYALERYFGNRGVGIGVLFTWRSIGGTLLISLIANFVCVYLILTSFPPDFPALEPQLIRIFVLSYLVFVLFNFFGDLVSVAITRHVVAAIAAGRCNIFRYLLLDLGGIILGYIVTLLPTLLLLAYALATHTPINPWVETGLLGSVLIPFFLFIFATTHMPAVFTIFALVAVLSVTIPTAIYLLLVMISYIFYELLVRYGNARIFVPLQMLLDGLLGLVWLGLWIAPLLAAYAAIY